jgi:hypothetical protein
MDAWSDEYWIRCDDPRYEGPVEDYVPGELALPIFSPRSRAALEAAGVQGIQWLPIRVFHLDGSADLGFSIANILNVVAAFDKGRSRYSVYPPDYFLPARRGDVSLVTGYVLRASEVQGLDIFRLAEYPVALFVSKHFADTWKANGFTGIHFKPVLAV